MSATPDGSRGGTLGGTACRAGTAGAKQPGGWSLAVRKLRKSTKKKQAKKSPKRAAPRASPPKRRKIAKVPKTKLVKPKKVRAIKRPKLVKAVKGKQRTLKSTWNYLRRLGLIKSKRDGRKIKANDRYAKKQVAKYSEVLSGRSKVYKVTKSDAKKYKKAGYKVVDDNLILQQKKGTRQKKKGRFIHTIERVPGGEIITIMTPHSYADMLRDLPKIINDPEIQYYVKRGWQFSFKFFGNFAYDTFVNTDLMIEYMQHYEAIASHSRAAFRNLELIIVLSGTKFRRQTKIRGPRKHRYNPKAAQRRRERIYSDPVKHQEYNRQARIREAKYRARKAKVKRAKKTKTKRR